LNKSPSSLETLTSLPGISDKIRLSDRQTLLIPFIIVANTIYGQYGMVAEYDLNGKPLRSWHDPTGKLIALGSSQMTLYKNKLYLGSFTPSVDYIATIDYN
jgi:hypothetical protein